MEKAYYYAGGRKIPVLRLQTARVARLPENRAAITLPGWLSVPLGNADYQLLLRADVLPERTQLVFPQADAEILNLDGRKLAEIILEAEKTFDLSGSYRDSVADNSMDEIENTPALIEGRTVDNGVGSLLLPTGEVLVQFPESTNLEDRQLIFRKYDVTDIQQVTFLPRTYKLRGQRMGAEIDLANRLFENEAVEFAAPNFIEETPLRNGSSIKPANAYFAEQWHLHEDTNSGNRADISALEAWAVSRGSKSIVICIIDSGIDSGHEAFLAPGKLVQGFDFSDHDVLADPTTSTHGTSCAGVAAAPWGIGRAVGIAPECSLMPIRRAPLSDHLTMAEAFSWAATHGADVISCSFGFDQRPWTLPDVVRIAIDGATTSGRNGRGCVLVWAAGNGNEVISTDEWASYKNVIAVAACTDQGVRAKYSDYGPEVDICAPSSGGVRGITTTSIGGYTNNFGGTSSAAPLVAGVAALLLSVDPSLPRQKVRDILCHTADKIDPISGAYDANGHSNLYGYGRVNAASAIRAISVLEMVARISGNENQIAMLNRFVAEVLGTSEGGRVIQRFLELRRFTIARLIKDSEIFRAAVARALLVAAAAVRSIDEGTEFRIGLQDEAAIASAARTLLNIGLG